MADAKNRLTELVRAVEKGETVTICRRGRPVADLVRTAKKTGNKRRFDSLKGEIEIYDPDWWKPMSEKEVDALLRDSD